jgi:hypothetical protein
MAQIRLLEVDRVCGTFAVEAAARFDDDDVLAAEQTSRSGRRIAESFPGMLKLYMGAPITIVSAARNSASS